ncbi:probable LRR receptor-like serine/threonine-protein kinase At1g74360 [Malania oleifera]|uniref:probable LRR receptor-like serine/threonine-protein kinase At1g74360 n=1 Tax=Malania oleifera TaxID=397392 RepID=UPI0025AE641A|nr:probable LRR receptor-like serine/threonine-protein kinase At1g74360 [Malania oleifera]
MSDDETDPWRVQAFIIFLFLIAGTIVAGDSLQSDREVLLNLKSFLEKNNRVYRGRYTEWKTESSSPCAWPGISCNDLRVTGIHLSDNNISGQIFENFSALTELTHLDLSMNTISGTIPADLSRCQRLVFLNLSHNIIHGELNLTGLNNLKTLDLSMNRICGEIGSTFPAICDRLVVANISVNNFTGRIDDCFEECRNLQYLDLSSNNFSGEIWRGFVRLQYLSVSDNKLVGPLTPSMFADNCSLRLLDLSENDFVDEVPKAIANCRNLSILNLWGNNFTGRIPSEIGSISSLEGLFLGENSFSREIPESLQNLSHLKFLDLSKNNFKGNIQTIFGKFVQLKFLVLHGNSYTGGINSSGILKLPNVSRLDLSYNNFSGPLPVEISEMQNLKYLILAFNQFNGTIPLEYGKLPILQALDLSFNRLTGSIPATIGNLSSLLWLMLANNSLSGEIPTEIGNCSSLLWLNLANNQLSGKIPPELKLIGKDPSPTFLSNQQNDRIIAGSGECLTMKRWVPADYPPFSFVYTLLTRKKCRSIWERMLTGYGLFPACTLGSMVRTFQISGYVQLSGNLLTGELPPEIGEMQNFSLLHFGFNRFYGRLPPVMGQLPLMVLNISRNNFSGEIPIEISQAKCLQGLDMSYNNFSGEFPTSLANLTELTKFNISYNPSISGEIPTTGQFSTFEKESYLGDPLLRLPTFLNTTHSSPANKKYGGKPKRPTKFTAILVFLALTLAFFVCGGLSLIVCILVKHPEESPGYLLEESKYQNGFVSCSSTGSSPWLSDRVKVIRLDKTAFTHADILKATGNFSDDRILGKGGFGTVYRGVLPDGREVAVKKLQREGVEGEKEFRSEMEVLTGNGFGWPHPNLVTLYGWCLHGAEKLLVYEYMKGGSLEELVSDREMLTWQRRVDVAVDVARALVFLHHECFPAIVHRDVKASNVMLDGDGKARVTDFGLARVVDAGDTHVSTMVAGTVGYVAPEYGQTWQATTKGDVYSYGVLAMELATGRRALDGGEECLVEWARRVAAAEQEKQVEGEGEEEGLGLGTAAIPVALLGWEAAEGAEKMCDLLRIGIKCAAETPQARPNMKEVLAMLINICNDDCRDHDFCCSPPS